MGCELAEPYDIEGEFYLFLTGGKTKPVFSGYRPVHKVHDNYLTSASHDYLEVNQVLLGQTVKVGVKFITPDVYPACLWVGREIDVQEASHVIGKLKIIKIFNAILEGDPKTYNPKWIEPTNLDKSGKKISN
jgi:translation elongation factor EF-Tu-like GTPase